jgi:hypothetical protein
MLTENNMDIGTYFKMVIDLTLGVLWVAERRITGRFLIHC